MKRKNLRSRLASLAVFLLVGVMGFTAAFSAVTGRVTFNANISTNSTVQSGKTNSNLGSLLDPDKIISTSSLKASDKIGLIIEMDEQSLIDTYLENPDGYESYSDYRLSQEGMNAAERIKNQQMALFNKIKRQVDVKLKYNYVGIMNGFAIEITYGDRAKIDKIAYKANVVNTLISEHYEAPEVLESASAVENYVNAQSTGIFDSKDTRNEGFSGQNQVVAVLDTGLDWEHVAFDPNHYLFDLETQKEEGTLRFTKDELEKKIPTLAANNLTSNLTISDIYINEKIPFAYDYSDQDPEVSSSIDNEHGTHVAGIIAGHSDTPYELIKYVDGEEVSVGIYLREITPQKDVDGKTLYDDKGNVLVESVRYYQMVDGKRVYHNELSDTDFDKPYNSDGEIDWVNGEKDGIIDEKDGITNTKIKRQITGITGVAPQAQLAIFKVFSDFDTGADSEYLLCALEDCVNLNVDVINMSLGADCGFQEESDAADSIYSAYELVGKAGISLVVAAANSGSTGLGSHYGLNLISNPDSGTVGTPSSYDGAFTVASISGVKSKYLLAVDAQGKEYGAAYFTEATKLNGETYDFINDLYKAVKANPACASYIQKDGTLRIPFVTISGVGNGSDYSATSVTNKIALIQRGDISFEDKVDIAAQKGALACIIFNNAAGIIRMQVGDKMKIPTCSITMDAVSNFKNKDGFIIIDEDKEAGPFMSDFSSLGGLPNLVLKPEISAHGGEIYSAIPGDETAYAVLSGTSMACPNMAGVVTLLRQYMQSYDDDKLVASKFNVDLNNSGTIDSVAERNLMESRIYQIIMSTATIAHNEEDNPYSPRKQGAGLADLERARAAEQYLTVDVEVETDDGTTVQESERTKVQLKDDPERTGEYTIEFYVNNVSNKEVSYSISDFTMTEGISTNGKTVNEKSHMLEGNTITVAVDDEPVTDGKIVVSGNGRVKVTYTIKLGKNSIDWLEQFPNGMYVEGYVCLTNLADAVDAKGNKIANDLNIPFLAFYGDWTDAPMLDYSVYEVSEDEKKVRDKAIDEDDARYSGGRPLMMVGKVVEDGLEYTLGMGQYMFAIPDEYEYLTPVSSEDKAALSFDTSSAMCNLYGIGGYLRNAKRVFWVITDANTGRIIKQDVYYDAHKSQASSGLGGAWLEIPITDLDVVNNCKYNIAIYPVLDWPSEIARYDIAQKDSNGNDIIDARGKKVLDVQANIQAIISHNEQYNAQNPDRARRYYWSSDFWIDTDAPFLSNTEVRVVKNGDRVQYFLDTYITDNHYAMAMNLEYYSEHESKFVSFFSDNGLRPVDGDRNSTKLVSYDITRLWDQINEGLMYRINYDNNIGNVTASQLELGKNLTTLQVQLFDYAFNRSYYEIDLYEIFKETAVAQAIAIGDTGNYQTYTSTQEGKAPVTILTSQNDNVAVDALGNPRTINELTIVEGQKFNIEKAIITTPSNAWREDFLISASISNDLIREGLKVEDLIVINTDDGEVYSISAGGKDRLEITLTVKSRSNPAVYTDLKINVLSDEEAAKYDRLNYSRLKATTNLNGITFTENYKKLNAGETYLIEFEANPWYYNIDWDKYFVIWETGNENYVTVERMDDSADDYAPYKAWVTANDGKWDENGEYIENFAIENDEFVTVRAILAERVENHTSSTPYDEKYGYYKTTNYKGSFNFQVYQEFVVEGGSLTEYHGTPKNGVVTLPSNISITSIGSNLFYKRNDIKKIIFNEGLETISSAACAYMANLEEVVLPSTLIKIDRSAFAGYMKPTFDAPQTVLMKIDTTACAKPLQILNQAFAMQRYIGLDLPVDDQGNRYFDESNITFLSDEEANKFSSKMFRVIGEFTFYDMQYVKYFDLSGMRVAGTGAFYGIGSGARKEGKDVTVVLGENTMGGLGAFIGSGITRLETYMRRVSSQMFYGVTEQGASEDEVIPLYLGELEEVVFKGNDVVIEEYAFVYSSVKNVTFEGTVESLDNGAFANSLLENIEFRSTVKHIGTQAFFNTQLTEAKLPAGLKTLGSGVFASNKKLTTVTIDKDCEISSLDLVIDVSAQGAHFDGCPNFERFVVDSGNKYFQEKDGILYNLEGNKIISVPGAKDIRNSLSTILAGVDEIGSFAFASNGVKAEGEEKASFGITEIDLTGINVIGEGAFFNCIDLTSVKLSSGMTKIPTEAFYACVSLANIDFNGAPLTEIGMFAFFNSALTDVTDIPDSVSRIGQYSFAENEELVNFRIPEGVSAIEDGTFYNCASLKSLTNTGWIESIGDIAFTYSALETAEFRNCLTVGELAFAFCSDLKSVNLPKATEIGTGAFAADVSYDEENDEIVVKANITEINIQQATRIADRAFYYQNKLMVAETSACKYFGEYSFFYCESLVYAPVTAAVTIEANAFTGTAIETVTLASANLSYVDPSAYTSTKITAYSVQNSDTYFTDNGILYKRLDEDKYELVSYPINAGSYLSYDILDGTVRIADFAFYSVEYLIRVNIPESVRSIGDCAFINAKTRIFNFDSLLAPELETDYVEVTTDYNDTYVWQVYSNFVGPFSYSNGKFGAFKYNPIRPTGDDEIVYVSDRLMGTMQLQNDSYTGGGLNNGWFSMILSRPSNAVGFDTFIWANYFDNVMLTPERLEQNTIDIMDRIRQLPDASSITLANKSEINLVRVMVDNLKSDQQRAFIRDAGLIDVLTACEKRIATLEGNNTRALEAVYALIKDLPSPFDITDADADAVNEALEAYNALSNENKAAFDPVYLEKLNACKAALDGDGDGKGEDKGCGSCSTVAFDAGNGGGIGLMLGLLAVMFICLAVVLIRKKKSAQK